ncbi:MAG TPA: high-potential iron-sulfur protein, partial [Verrucomicrobiae bacterium]
HHQITRRAVVKGGFIAGAGVTSLRLIAQAAPAAAADLPALDPKDPAAVTLGFINDTAKVDPVANPLHAADQNCGNCEQFIGKPSDVRGGCVLFAGKSVPAAGWCKVWRKSTKL